MGASRKNHPTPVEAERLASDIVMNDIRADIVSTDRGFFLYRGLGPDGYTTILSTFPIRSRRDTRNSLQDTSPEQSQFGTPQARRETIVGLEAAVGDSPIKMRTAKFRAFIWHLRGHNI
jgi:hypothetical protein